ncbi:single-strand DNA-binding protein [Rhodopseudomonas faecalis]|uniref:Single-stranded DNA-binding protein n=1 Tax=Rhodopseudomonas faecalis TaxID=99655 RepID=A0A318TJU5_9BRAD|nr:single-stranded DNA-binding protein [Rhodopseudomonas faecalis]PYF04986.1 single-strand DNA-binding protein [Rhodopseudomonas faecalis]
MAGDMNRATLIGRLGGDPECKRLQNGSRVVNFSIATSESWRDKNTGERKEKTQWHRVVIWTEGLCNVAEQYLRRGSKCLVEGAIEHRKWTDQNGVEKYTTEIVLKGFNAQLILLGGSGGGDGGGDSGTPRSAGRAPSQNIPMDDDIPF